MPEVGALRQDYLPAGPVTVGFAPEPGAAEQMVELSAELEANLKQLKTQIAEAVREPWAEAWSEAHSWGQKIVLLHEAYERGLKQGLHAWGQDQVSFFESVGNFFEEVGATVVDTAEDAWNWYQDQPLIVQVIPPLTAAAAAQDISQEIAEEIEQLWARRDQILALFKALCQQGVNSVEMAIVALADAPGDLGDIMQMLYDKGSDWIQGLIEVCRQTDALSQVFTTLGTILYSIIPPNLWVEGIAAAAGYIIPEILLTILLIAISAISEGAGATALVARIASYTEKLGSLLDDLGDLGAILRKVADGIRAIVGKIVALTQAALAHIDEAAEGVANAMNPVLRHVSVRGERRVIAKQFMEEQGMAKKEIRSHITGIDFSKPIKVRPLEEGEQFDQWNYRARERDFAQGEYYTTPGTDKHTLGIPHGRRNLYSGLMEQREKRVFEATQPKQVLESIARDKRWKVEGQWTKTKGGGRQIFSKSKDAFKEVGR